MTQGSTRGRPETAPRSAKGTRAASYLCALHLWSLHAIAASNFLAGFSGVLLIVSERWSRIPWRRLAYALLPLAVYTLMVLISTFRSQDPSVSLGRVSKLWALAHLPLFLVALRGYGWVRKVADGVIVIASVMALHALGQALFGGDLSRGLADPSLRLRSTFSHHMTLAGFLMLALVLTLAQLACRRNAWRWGRWLAAVLMSSALGLTLTRNAWLGLAAALLVLATVHAWRWLAALPVLALAALLLAPPLVGQRLTTILDLQNLALGERVAMWRAGAEMIRQHPWWGVGPRMVRQLYPDYATGEALRDNVLHLHNSYVQVAAETGLPALGAFAWLLGWGGWRAFRGYRTARAGDDPATDLYLASLLAIVAYAVAGLLEDNWNDTEVQRLLFFLLAIPGCLAAGSKQLQSSSASLATSSRTREV